MTGSIAVSIICLCYIKKNTVTEETLYRKAMAISLFLVLGGAINITGQVIPGIVAYYAEAPRVYLVYVIAAVYHHSLPEASSRAGQEDCHLGQVGQRRKRLKVHHKLSWHY